jgi:hypothetical protein
MSRIRTAVVVFRLTGKSIVFSGTPDKHRQRQTTAPIFNGFDPEKRQRISRRAKGIPPWQTDC